MNKIFLGLCFIVFSIAIAGMWASTTSTSSDVYTVNELSKASDEKNRIRIGGKVSDDPFQYETEPKLKLTFLVEDREDVDGKIPVVFEGLKPDMFANGREVLLDGDFREGTFYATSLLTQCPSKYQPPTDG